MHFDILIFAIIAAFLIFRLRAVLGTRHGEERERPNPFAAPEPKATSLPPILAPAKPQALVKPHIFIDAAANKDGRIDTGLDEIAAADVRFDVNDFMIGAKGAFEMIVDAYNRGDRGALKPLLSAKLYADFERGIVGRETTGETAQTEIHRIKEARITEAHLGGTMAYITLDYVVEQTSVTRDRDGKVIDGDPARIATVHDIWTFTRDIRTPDPNWMLIETKAAEQ